MTVEPSEHNGSTGVRCTPSPVGRVVDIVILAPLGLGAAVVDEIPIVIRRGRQQVALARFIGKLVVDQSVRQLRRRATSDIRSVFPYAEHVVEPSPSATEPGGPAAEGTAEPTAGRVAEPVAEGPSKGPSKGLSDGSPEGPSAATNLAVEELVLADYEHLSAAHVVAKLESLDQQERDAIELYELAHRHRRTILGRLEQLRST